ncbi:hypothetical protein [Streptomyces sp. ML-6]|uniref:hypothetical protein n=1 Tax=Streptomyces sp. ML-6 TaxID=2982693 RepID=UPI0024BF10DB|nr:hypothetical protein [Streptomyces sp. ML-6]MDK0524876.1 hypothetical protein [Streptomyces sp. ML-6]
MSDEREQHPGNAKIIYNYRYECDQCTGDSEGSAEKEGAEKRRAEHREEVHGGLRPKAGDRIVEYEVAREILPEEPAVPEEPTVSRESSNGLPIGLIIFIFLVIAFLSSK